MSCYDAMENHGSAENEPALGSGDDDVSAAAEV